MIEETKLLPCPVEDDKLGDPLNIYRQCRECPNRRAAPTLADLERAAWKPASEPPQHHLVYFVMKRIPGLGPVTDKAYFSPKDGWDKLFPPKSIITHWRELPEGPKETP